LERPGPWPTTIEAMLAKLDRAKDPAVWATAIYAGLRRGELAALLCDDVYLATGVIRVERGWDEVVGEVAPRSRQGRRKAPIPAVLRDHLDAYLPDAHRGLHRTGRDPRFHPGSPSRTTSESGPCTQPRSACQSQVGRACQRSDSADRRPW
jgi:integrase